VRDSEATPRRAVWAWVAEAVILLAALGAACWGLQTVILGDSLSSRLATVDALVHHGTWYIDRPEGEPRSVFEARTVDKVRLDGRILSTKPPMLPLIMTAEYWALNRFLDWDLATRETLKSSIQVMTFTLSVIPFLVALYFFSRVLGVLAISPAYRVALLFVAAFGTQLTGFAATFNNHVPAAGALMVALYFALALGTGKREPSAWRFAAFGFFAGLVFTLDMPVTIYVALAGLYLIVRFPRQAILWGGAGIAVPLGIHFIAMLVSSGSVLPIQMREGLYLYEGSPWRNPLGIDGLNEPLGTYLFGMTFGRYGTFLLFPVLLLGLGAVVMALISSKLPHRWAVLTGFLGFVVLTAYYATSTNNYGGMAYGFRWHMASMPVLLLMAGPLLERWRPRAGWAVIALLTAVSMYSAYECFRQPWSVDEEWTVRLFFGPIY
jgi:hypothetical protein